MKKSYLIILLLMFLSFNLFAQIDREIANFVDSTEIRVNNGRKMLIKSLQDGNKEKTVEIYNYLLDVSALNNCDAVSVVEKLYLLSILEDWEQWLSLAANYKDVYQRTCYPKSYEIVYPLFEMTKEKAIEPIINNTQLSSEEKDLIMLYFTAVDDEANERDYRKQHKSFKSNYPNSAYKYFVKNYLPAPKAKGYWGYGIGASFVFPTQNLAESFDSNINFHMSMDFSINKVYAALYFVGGVPKLQQPFEGTVSGETTMYHTGESFSYFEGGLALGYYVYRGKYIKTASYVTIAGAYLQSNRFKGSEKDKEFKVFGSFVTGPGIHNEVKLFEFNSNPNYYGYSIKNQIFLKADAGYNIITKQDFDFFKGNNMYVRLALMWAIGDF